MANAVKTDHPHIVRLPGVCGGEPIVDGLRVTVRQVATLHQRGESIQEIGEDLGLTEAQVYHALSYFFDHRERDHRADRSRRTSPCPIHPALKRFSLGYTLIATSWLAWLSICGPKVSMSSEPKKRERTGLPTRNNSLSRDIHPAQDSTPQRRRSHPQAGRAAG